MKYKSDILEVIHQSAIDKYEIGAISEARMRDYDEMCLEKKSNIIRKHEPKKRKRAAFAAV